MLDSDPASLSESEKGSVQLFMFLRLNGTQAVN